MKTVPVVRLADTADAVVLPDLPEEIALAMADIAGAAREGLLALSVAAGMANRDAAGSASSRSSTWETRRVRVSFSASSDSSHDTAGTTRVPG